MPNEINTNKEQTKTKDPLANLVASLAMGIGGGMTGQDYLGNYYRMESQRKERERKTREITDEQRNFRELMSQYKSGNIDNTDISEAAVIASESKDPYRALTSYLTIKKTQKQLEESASSKYPSLNAAIAESQRTGLPIRSMKQTDKGVQVIWGSETTAETDLARLQKLEDAAAKQGVLLTPQERQRGVGEQINLLHEKIAQKRGVKGMPGETGGKFTMTMQAASDIKEAMKFYFPDYTETPTGEPRLTGDFSQKRAFEAEAWGGTGVPWTDSRTAASLVRNAVNAKLRGETGAAASPAEIVDIERRFKPSKWDNARTARSKMYRLYDFMINMKAVMDPQGNYVYTRTDEEKGTPQWAEDAQGRRLVTYNNGKTWEDIISGEIITTEEQ